jgi:hypothetical protein
MRHHLDSRRGHRHTVFLRLDFFQDTDNHAVLLIRFAGSILVTKTIGRSRPEWLLREKAKYLPKPRKWSGKDRANSSTDPVDSLIVQ